MSDLSLRLQQAASQLPVSSYFDEALFQREQERIFQPVRATSVTAWRCPTGRLLRAEARGRGPRAGAQWAHGGVELVSNVCRHRQAVMLKGAARWADRQRRRQHRLPAAPLDLQAQRRAAGRTAFRARSLPEPEQLQPARVERPAVRGQRPRHRRRPGRHGPVAQGPELRRLCARQGRAARVQLQLEDLHRGLSGGLPRRPLPPRPGQLRHLRRPAAGSLARTTRCRPWAWPHLGKAGSEGVRALARGAAGLPRTASRPRSAAPSG
jgi:hypothetical protein